MKVTISVLLILVGLAFAEAASCNSLSRSSIEEIAFKEGCNKNEVNKINCTYYDFKYLNEQLDNLYSEKIIKINEIRNKKRFIRAHKAWLEYIVADCLSKNGAPDNPESSWHVAHYLCMSNHFNDRINSLR